MKLVESIASYTGESYIRMKQVLSDEVKDIIATVIRNEKNISVFDNGLLQELIDMDVFARDNGEIRPNTAIFFQEDIEMMYIPIQDMGRAIAGIVKDVGFELADNSPNVKNFIGSIIGMGQGLHTSLKSMKLASNWQTKTGKYEKSKVDFNQQCEAYIRFGEDLQIKRIHRGKHFTSTVIGPGNNDYFSYLWNSGSSTNNEDAQEYRIHIINYLTDTLPLVIKGELHDESLRRAALSAHIDISDTSSVITIEDAQKYQLIIKKISEACTEYILSNIRQIHNLLSQTIVGQQGVPPENMMMNFWRYLRRTSAVNLYINGFLNDNVPKDGTITIFYDNNIDYFG